MILKFDMVQSISVAVVVLLIGSYIVKKVSILRKYCIPAPVVGGLVFSILTLILKQANILEFQMDTTLQTFAMTAFFTTVGFSASLRLLKKGGVKVFIFLLASVVLVLLQNILGISLASVFNLDPLIGLAVGSIPLTGGHGTSAAFGPLLEEAGAIGANTIALAAATFGLISGSIIGGPLANRLIIKNDLVSKIKNKKDEYADVEDIGEEDQSLTENNIMTATIEILIAMGFGTIISSIFESANITLPVYIGGMLAGAIIRNISDMTKTFNVPMNEIDLLGNVSLSLYLSMALMGLKLWQLADLAVPFLVMLLGQVLLMYLYATFVTFRVMGKDYDAAVLSAGQCGFGLGAVANGIANMNSVVDKFVPSPTAFFVMPIVGSLFIDFINAGVIMFIINYFA